MKLAVIDVGSNSVRLMLERESGLNEKYIRTTQLAEGLDTSGELSDAAMSRTAEAIEELAALAKSRGTERIAAFATEAVRAAGNGADFIRRVYACSGVVIDLIDGETEAACGFGGAREDFSGAVAVVDIGGASVEYVAGDERIDYAKSLPIGVVRLRDRYRGDYAALDRELPALLDGFSNVYEGTLIGIGGTPTTVLAMARRIEEYDPERVHGDTLNIEEIRAVERVTRALGVDELMARYPMLVRRRAEVIPYGATLLAEIVERFGKGAIRISEKDNLEGYARLRLGALK